MTPGPRQTVNRACHPTMGEGSLVFDNGPAFFAADSGDVLPLRSAFWGGSGLGGSFDVGITHDDERVRFDTTGRPRGETHARVVADIHGPGWLVRASGGVYRFDGDDGRSTTFDWSRMWVGLPQDMLKSGNTRAKIPKDHERWITIQSKRGGMFVYTYEATKSVASVEKPMQEAMFK